MMTKRILGLSRPIGVGNAASRSATGGRNRERDYMEETMVLFEEIKNALTERQKGLFTDDIPKYLRHYTKLPYLLKILKTGRLKLSDTEGFKDPKDRAWTKAYRKRVGKELFAMCCTWETELIHHWNTYAKGKFGCCISFDGQKLIEAADAQPNIKHGLVDYKKNIPCDDIPESVEIEKLLFTKAWAYRCECEYRFISETEKELAFDLGCIKRITITANMDKETFAFFKESIEKQHSVSVTHSRLEKDNE